MARHAERSDTAQRVAAEWAAGGGHLLAVARRVLGGPVEAEDVVQDAFARLARQPVEEIEDLHAWLVVAVRRLALDRLRSAHHRLSEPTDRLGTAPAADPADPADPADRVTLDDEVRHALDAVLDRLTPAQRTAFLLHEVFGVPFAQIGDLVGRSPGACRQAASEGRKAIRDRAGPHRSSRETRSDEQLGQVAERFTAAARGGDLEALLTLLDPRVSGWATIGGRVVGYTEGARDVAAGVLRFLGPSSGSEVAVVPLGLAVGILVARSSRPFSLVRLEIAGGRVRGLRGLVLSAAAKT